MDGVISSGGVVGALEVGALGVGAPGVTALLPRLPVVRRDDGPRRRTGWRFVPGLHVAVTYETGRPAVGKPPVRMDSVRIEVSTLDLHDARLSG
jgi:hypothetical protein